MRRWPAGRSGPPEVSPAGTSVSGRLPETCPDRGAARPARPGAQTRHLISDGLSGLAALALLAGALLATAPQAQAQRAEQPSISIISTPSSVSTYKIGEKVEIQLDFDEDVTVLGKPAIRLGISFGSGRHNGMTSASYVRGSGTDKLVFSLRVSSHPIYHGTQLAVTNDATLNCGTGSTGTRLYHARSSEGIRRESNSSNIDDFLVNCGILSPSTHRIDGRNSPATGRPLIIGRVEAGQYLEVSLYDVEDANGVPDKAANVTGWYGVPSAGYGSDYGPDGFATVTTNYGMTWQRVDADGFSNPTEVWNPFTTYKLTPDDVGKRIRVRALFIDNKGTPEEVVSDATPVVVERGRSGAVLTPRSVCSRTPAVRDAIVNRVLGVTDCANVSGAQLQRIDDELRLHVNALGTSGLRAWDFARLSRLKTLQLGGTGLTALPPGIFDELTGLTHLDLSANSLTALPPGVFDKLTELTILSLEDSALNVLPAGIFDKLTKLTSLSLAGNALPVLRPDVFDELTALTALELSDNDLTVLSPDVFDELTALTALGLSGNDLTALPEGVFEKLTALTRLSLFDNPGVATFLPVANAGPDQGSVSASSSVTLSGSATGPWGNNVTWAWKQVTSTGADVAAADRLTLTGATTATPSFTMPSGSVYFELTVTARGTALTDTDTVT